MKKLLIASLAAALTVAANADGVTDKVKESLPAETGSGAGVAQVEQAQEEDPAPAPTAIRVIEDYFNSKEDWNKGYDEENDRIIVTDFIEFDVKNPKVSDAFVELRKEKMSELLLKAKAKIIEQIMSKMSGSRVLEVPGNPIAKQIQKEKDEADRAVAVAKEELGKLDKELAASIDALGAQMTARQVVDTMTQYYTELEAKNLPASYQADQKAQYKNAKAAFEEAKKAYEELAKKADALKGQVTKSMKTTLSRVSAMPIYGCTVLQQAESITQKNGVYQYQIAILYSWSGEMMRASGEILKGKAVKFKPGKKSLKQWIAGKAKNGALSQWVGPRTYIDNKGAMHFIGIACAPLKGDADDREASREAAELEAAGEVMFSLFADASSSKTLNKVMQTTQGADGQKETRVYKEFSKSQSESFKDIQISGNAEIWTGLLRHAPSGLDMQVVVYAVNSGNQKTLRDVQTRATALGIEVNTYQEMERGRQAMLKGTYEASKNNAAARAAGAEGAAAALTEKAAKSASQAPAATAPSRFKSSNGAAGKGNGMLQTGATTIIDDDEQ